TGSYELRATAKFDPGDGHPPEQTDTFTVDVLSASRPVPRGARIALFDPRGESAAELEKLGVGSKSIDAGADLSGYDTLIIGKHALTVDGPGPDLARVRDGLKVIVFEQASQVLEKRLGFRVAEYGLR